MNAKGLHPKNRFRSGYNFNELCSLNPALSAYCRSNPLGKTTIDFSKAKAVKALNIALLFTYKKELFWDFPASNLCPPIPGRLDYLLHLHDLIGKGASKTILDIGTGATCIYPLLGVLEFNWNFVASDTNSLSLENAQRIIERNNLTHCIQLRQQQNKQHILKGLITKNEQFDAVMCNPPFYKSRDDAYNANLKKSKNLGTQQSRNFSGIDDELWYPGGEKAFLHNYMYESSQMPNASRWFTSLVSQKDTVKSLKASAQKLKVTEFKIIQMHQGNKQTRIVAWKF